jgi:hypothetical protein
MPNSIFLPPLHSLDITVAVIGDERQGRTWNRVRSGWNSEAAAMLRRCFSIAALLGLLGLGMPACRAPASLAAGPSVAEAAAQIPPIPAGLARVWFLRQFQPSEGLRTPMIFINGAALASSVPGTAFYRDVVPGTYTFSVETCTIDTNQAATLNLAPGSVIDLEIQSLSSFRSWDCPIADTFYVRVISPAWAQLYAAQLAYLGAR